MTKATLVKWERGNETFKSCSSLTLNVDFYQFHLSSDNIHSTYVRALRPLYIKKKPAWQFSLFRDIVWPRFHSQKPVEDSYTGYLYVVISVYDCGTANGVKLTCTSGGKIEAIFPTLITFHPKYPGTTYTTATLVTRHTKRAIGMAVASWNICNTFYQRGFTR